MDMGGCRTRSTVVSRPPRYDIRTSFEHLGLPNDCWSIVLGSNGKRYMKGNICLSIQFSPTCVTKLCTCPMECSTAIGTSFSHVQSQYVVVCGRRVAFKDTIDRTPSRLSLDVFPLQESFHQCSSLSRDDRHTNENTTAHDKLPLPCDG